MSKDAYRNSRRRFLASGLLLAFAPSFARSGRRSDSRGRPAEKARVPLGGFDRVIVPRGHGLTLALKGLKYNARYPSRDQSLQLMVFLNGRSGLAVLTKEPAGAVVDWEIQNDYLELSVPGAASAPEVSIISIGPHWQEAAEIYHDVSVSRQSMVPRQSGAWSFISTGSSPDDILNLRQFDDARRFAKGSLGLWLTQYRRYRFDVGYPDYVPRDMRAYQMIFDWARANDAIVLPYVNAILFDPTHSDDKSFVREWGVIDSHGRLESYSSRLPHLHVACPCGPWADVIVDIIRSTVCIGESVQPYGAYLDVLTATRPRVCWSENHSHPPGDPSAWVRGVLRILRQLADLSLLVEGNADVYLHHVDGFLMHEYSPKPNVIPLWNSVFGQRGKSYGWDMRAARTGSEVRDEVLRANTFGVNALGSPYMTRRVEVEHQGVLNAIVRERSQS